MLNLLTHLYKSGLAYSTLNTGRCMFSSVLSIDKHVTIGEGPLVKRFMKGVYQLKPALPRYHEIWDVDCVLTYLKTLTPVNTLS